MSPRTTSATDLVRGDDGEDDKLRKKRKESTAALASVEQTSTATSSMSTGLYRACEAVERGNLGGSRGSPPDCAPPFASKHS